MDFFPTDQGTLKPKTKLLAGKRRLDFYLQILIINFCLKQEQRPNVDIQIADSQNVDKMAENADSI
jgi:hypothetical protein